jgi:cell shape-determining protein MreC
MSPRRKRSRATLVFSVLMALSAILAFSPPRWTAWTRVVLQPIVWMQWLLSSGARQVATVAGTGQSPDPALGALTAEKERLELELRNVRAQQQLLEEQLEAVTGLRDELRSSARLVVARVVAYDASPQREALTISRGSANSGSPPIRVGDWVAAADRDAARDDPASGVELLARQGVIGQVAAVQPWQSIVRLITDRAFGPVRVRVARRGGDGTWKMSEREALIYGRGGEKLEILRASENFFAGGYRAVMLPISDVPPIVLTLGSIESAETTSDSPLHFNVRVRPWRDLRRLHQVYVLSER